MAYAYKNHFVLPGDTYVSKYQTMHFDKGQTYEVSKVFVVKGKQVFYLKDRNGFDVKANCTCDDWEFTSKTQKVHELRILRARLIGACGTELTSFRSNNPGGRIFYNITSSDNVTFLNSPDTKFRVERYEKESCEKPVKKLNYTTHSFKSEEDMIAFFVKELKASDDHDYYTFSMTGVDWKVQNDIDFKSFILTHNITCVNDEKDIVIPAPPPENLAGEYLPRYFATLDIKMGIEKLMFLLFNTTKPSKEQKELILTIWNIFEESPKAYGSTSVAKLLKGKAKKVLPKLQAFDGLNPMDLKYDALFNIVDWVETVSYSLKIFNTKTDNDVQYLGNRNIDAGKMEEVKKLLK